MQDTISGEELLQYAIQNGMIDAALVQKKIEMQKKKEIINKHPYKIYKGADGYWYTYLPLDNGRKKIKSKTQDGLEDKIYEFYAEKEYNPTVEVIFNEWLEKKLERKEISAASYDRYKVDFNKYFKKIKNKHIQNINEIYLEDYIKDSISEFEMTAKAYAGFRTIIYGIFKYAKRRKLIEYNVMNEIQDMEISRRAFRKVVKSMSDQVYLPEEKEKMENYLIQNLDIINLGLLLMFKTGVRVGELATLKKEDITDYTIAITATETRYKDKQGNTHYEIKDFPKSEAGLRYAILPEKYKWVLDEILQQNKNGTYLFEKDGRRIKTYTFRKRLRYICSDKLNMQVKSPHKIRKTFGTILLDSGVRDSTILQTMGHADIGCTKGHYYYDRSGIEDKRNELNNISEL